MLKALIKKTFTESFRSYFVNPKTGKKRSKGGTAGMFVFFAFLMLILMGAFFGMAYGMSNMVFALKLDWLYFAVMGIIATALGIFGSVFNTYSQLYLAKDNDLLLSMPIPPQTILTARISLVYGLSLMYSGVVWVPSLICWYIFGNTNTAGIVFGILLTFVLALFVTVVTCALGWLVALIAKKTKGKSILTVILSVLFLGGYYAVCFRMGNVTELIMNNLGKVGDSVKAYGNLFYQLGIGASGGVAGLLIFTGVTALLAVLCYLILSKTFFRIVTGTGKAEKKVYEVRDMGAKSVGKALFGREMKRFTSSATYMLNAGLGILFLPAIAVFALVKKGWLDEFLTPMMAEYPIIGQFLPLIPLFAVCMIVSINSISVPSVSLEGKSLWIIRTLPVSGAQVLKEKERLHITLNLVPAVIAALVLCFCLKVDFFCTVLSVAIIWCFIRVSAAAGLILGLKHPNFQWTSEAMPIKQSVNTLFAMLIGWLLTVAVCGGFLLIRKHIGIDDYLTACLVVLACVSRMLDKWLVTKGGQLFDTL